MAYCKFCGFEGKWRTFRGKKVFLHLKHDCTEYIAGKLAGKIQKLTYHNFTRPTRCETCDKECFYYENEFGSRVFFDELGPPWPKHDCIERQQKRPKPPYQWEMDGYEPCVIYKVLPVPSLQRLVVYVRRLKEGGKLALRVLAPKIKGFIQQLHQPFVLKAVNETQWELNTYTRFFEIFRPTPYVCSEAEFALPEPPAQMEFW